MMGIKQRSFDPLVNVSLEELVPHDHFYRHLERTLDLSFVREFVHESYAGSGRPSIDPVVFFKLQLVMFFEGIRSERQLMRHAADRLSVRWYLGYDLGEPLPDHSSLTRIRERYGVEVFRRFFEQIVEQCQQAGLVWGQELYIDATKVKANASFLVTPAEVMENQPMLDLIWHTRFRWKLWPRHVTGDSKYGTEENIVAIETQHIRAYIPLPDSDHRTEFFSADRFRYDAQRDVYFCPAGKALHFFQAHSTERSRRYRARAKDCNHCALKAQCTTSKQGRSLCRSVDEAYLDRVRAYHTTEAYKKAYRKRSVCGWNPYSLKPKIGMGYAAFAYVNSGGLIVRPCGSLLDKISNVS